MYPHAPCVSACRPIAPHGGELSLPQPNLVEAAQRKDAFASSYSRVLLQPHMESGHMMPL